MQTLLYDKNKIDWNNLLFSNKKLWMLCIPVMAEQLLNSFMGLIDTMMVSRVGAVAMSAVSLSDTINMLVIQVFAAMATGGVIVCSHSIGQEDYEGANKAARQVFLLVLTLALALTIFGVVAKKPLLRLIFGAVEPDVMESALIYFFYSVLSYPAIGLFSSGSAFFRASGNTRFPMIVSIISNVINVVGNALLIFGFSMGVRGAAIATLSSRVFSAVVIYIALRKPKQIIVIRDYFKIRLDKKLMLRIMSIGIPSGVENGMFQFGKLVIQSSVSTLGTVAIAAQSMTNIFENVNGVLAQGVGIALLTVVGQAYGAGRIEEGRYYIRKMWGYAMFVMFISCIAVYAISNPVMIAAGMSEESKVLAHNMLFWITVFKPIFWCSSFTLPQGLRAFGDVRFTMIVAICTMWGLRVATAVFLIRVMGFGPIAVWIGMICDWGLRGAIFITRFLSRKCHKKEWN